jgi:hypothetical protein
LRRHSRITSSAPDYPMDVESHAAPSLPVGSRSVPRWVSVCEILQEAGCGSDPDADKPENHELPGIYRGASLAWRRARCCGPQSVGSSKTSALCWPSRGAPLQAAVRSDRRREVIPAAGSHRAWGVPRRQRARGVSPGERSRLRPSTERAPPAHQVRPGARFTRQRLQTLAQEPLPSPAHLPGRCGSRC